MDMRHALEKSCNVYFYTLGNMLGVDRIHKWSEKLGLVGKSGIDLPNEIESIVPSTEWKRQRTGEKWYAGETISVAIGQGQLSVTPMSLALMMATVANGGTRVVPRIVTAVDDGKGAGWQPVPPPANPFTPFLMKPETISALHDGLWMAVNGAGTGTRARIAGRDVSGKTGTAQVISNQGKARAGARRRTCATTAGSCSSHRATIPRLLVWCSPSIRSTATWRRRLRSTSWKPTLPRRTARRCRS